MTRVPLKILLAPVDPVHDVGLKMILRSLQARGHSCILLPPDLQPNEVVHAGLKNQVDAVLVSRTIGYQVAETLGRLVDIADASGLRDRAKLIVGGMGVRPELAAELGFDACFGPGTSPEEVADYLEGRPLLKRRDLKEDQAERDVLGTRDYRVASRSVQSALDSITSGILQWCEGKTSPGIQRAKIRDLMMTLREKGVEDIRSLTRDYAAASDGPVRAFHLDGRLPEGTRALRRAEAEAAQAWARQAGERARRTRFPGGSAVYVQFGTGCPLTDLAHVKACEAWGVDGVIHFDPSWAARTEGLLNGLIAHEGDGSIITPENIALMVSSLNPGTSFMLRAHRGLNTPEIAVIASRCGARLTKINPVYGSLGAGTDPERLLVDAVEAIKIAARHGLPFDIPTNDELCGVPAHKSFAGMLIVAALGKALGARPILNPLICHSPNIMVHGQMDSDFVDYNVAKIRALRSIMNAPIWAGEPVGFMTHAEDRVQSSLTTALHATLAQELGVEAVTIASSDEAYAHGPITIASRIDSLRAVRSALRFKGKTRTEPTPKAAAYEVELRERIEETIIKVSEASSFVAAIREGILGDKSDGVYPGRAGAGTVFADQR